MKKSGSYVSKTIRELPFSGIRRFFDLASEVKDIISLGVGEPDFFSPAKIRESAIYYLQNFKTLYSSNQGMTPLREEICAYVKRRFDLEYDQATQVLVTVGSSEAIDLALRAIVNPGEEVLVVEPCFVPYKPCVTMAGGVPVTITTKNENNFKVTPEELLENITEKTKAIIISFPGNPTGAIMEKEDIEKIAPILIEKDIIIITDEVYAELTYGGKKHYSMAQAPGLYDRTIFINGFSKSYAMTGWRLGYAAGPPEIISAMLKIHQYIVMCAPSIAQYAGIEALRSCDADVAEMREEYDMRRKFMLKGFREIGLSCFEALGAFYLFPSIQSSGMTSEEFCQKLLAEEKVALVPGSAFGDCGEGFVRCSYACSMENLETALERIEIFLKNIK